MIYRLLVIGTLERERTAYILFFTTLIFVSRISIFIHIAFYALKIIEFSHAKKIFNVSKRYLILLLLFIYLI